MEPRTETLSKEIIRSLQRECKKSNILSDETIDNLSTELLASERFLKTSANTLNVIGVWGPKIMASVIALAVVCRGVYATLKPNNNSEGEGESESEGEDSDPED